MEVFESGRRRGRFFSTLAALLFSVILLGGLAWALMQGDSASETPGSEEISAKEEATPSTGQVPDSAPETSGSEEAPPSTVQVPELYYASEVEGTLTDTGLELGTRSEASNATVPAGVVIEQDPAAGTTVEEGTAVDIVVSTGPEQVPAAVQAAPASVGTGSRQAPATTQVASNATGPRQNPAAIKAAPQAVPIAVDATSTRQATTAPTASSTTRTAKASSSVHDKTVQKKQEKKKKRKK